MKKHDILELTINEVAFPNKGIGYYEEKKIVVKNTLPGQRVLAKISKIRSSGVEGRLMEIVLHSPIEIEPGCAHFDRCGGCVYQHIAHSDELQIKEKQVLSILEQWGIKDFSYEGIVPSPSVTGYRNKCEFSFGDEEKGGKLALGMRKRQSMYEVVSLTDCNIVDEDYLKIVKYNIDFFQELNIPFYHKHRHDGVLRHLVVRKGVATGEILINLVTASNWGFSLEDYKNGLINIEFDGTIAGILHTQNDGLADVVKSQSTDILYGKDYFVEKLFDLEFKVTAFSFFQTNSKGAEQLYSIVRDFVGDMESKTVFDLYCGTGAIGQILAGQSKKVIGIELVEEAVEAAIENAKRNHLDNCTFIAGDVLKMVDQLLDKPDMIILDPPREGIHPKALDKILKFNAPEMVYVSCKPTSLGRDLALFKAGGYDVIRVKLMDMFPRTAHVETVCLLSKLKSDHHIEVNLNMDELDLTSAESKATYDEIKEYVLEKSGLKVTNLYIAQVKEKMGIKERENYNISKNEDAKVPNCPADKEKAIIAALKHFSMIK